MAELLATKYRPIMNAACMLGQSKNIYQAEIDSACETIDFFRYNVHYASKIYAMQPKDGAMNINHTEYRPLEGFILAVTPFNFTSIASNLCMTPVLMGNVALWKPSTTATLSNYYLMQLYKEAGLPDGVINFLPGSGALIGKVATASKWFSGIHFTWARPAARTSSSCTRAPMRRPSPPPLSAAPMSSRARSAPRLPACTSRRACGRKSSAS